MSLVLLPLGVRAAPASPGPVEGAPPPGETACSRASKITRATDPTEAAATYRVCLDAEPRGPRAESILFALAEVEDRDLGHYGDAIALYRSFASRFPASRARGRAEGRARHLEKARMAGDEPLRIYEEVIRTYGSVPRPVSVEKMEGIARDWPAFPLLPDVVRWLAYQKAEAGDEPGAREAYEAIARDFPGTPHALAAWASLGMMRIEKGDLEGATSYFRRITESSNPSWAARGRDLLRRVGELRLRKRMHHGCVVFLAATFAALLLATRWENVRWRTALDLRWEGVSLGAAAVFVLVLRRMVEPRVAGTALAILGGTTVLLAASGLFLASGRLRTGRGKRLYVVWLALAVFSLAYASSYASGLLPSLERTLVEGPEL